MESDLRAIAQIFLICWIATLICLFVGCGMGSAPISVSRTCASAPYTPNYSQDTDPASHLPNVLYHWTHMPVRVYFAGGDLITPTRKAQTLAGFGWWERQTGGVVSFAVVTDAGQADVSVQYLSVGKSGYGALTHFQVGPGGVLQSAGIVFNMTYLATMGDITAVAAHEAGHALGIGGHSEVNGDVMCYCAAAYGRSSLTERDINTLLTDYCPGAAVGSSAAVSGTSRATRSAALAPSTRSDGEGLKVVSCSTGMDNACCSSIGK